MLARKSVKQRIDRPTARVGYLMESFRLICNDAVRIGLASDASSLKRLSKLSYNSLSRYDVPSYYKLCAISREAGLGEVRPVRRKRRGT